ncbi:MAG: hypothetical protein ACI4N3_00200 [Alphaproteobacteria bacterium]
MYSNYNESQNYYGPKILTTLGAFFLCGLLLSVPIVDYIEDKKYTELPLTTGTVVEKSVINKTTIFSIDTDGNKDTIEKLIKVRNNRENTIYIINMKEDSQIQFADNSKKTKLDKSSIYKIDNFIVKQR